MLPLVGQRQADQVCPRRDGVRCSKQLTPPECLRFRLPDVSEAPEGDTVAYQPKLGPVAGGMDLPGEPLGFGGYGSRCRDCGSTDLIPQEGCMTCSACGYSKC